MNWTVILIPLLIPVVASIGLGLGLWMSVLTAKYRDFSQITGFLAQALMYATPIIYPLSEVPEQYQTWVSLNPMAPIVEAFRYSLLSKGVCQFTFLFTLRPLHLLYFFLECIF